MINVNGKFSGKIIIKKMEFDEILSRYVTQSNETSGKVNIPAEFIGSEVFVVIPKKKSKKRNKK